MGSPAPDWLARHLACLFRPDTPSARHNEKLLSGTRPEGVATLYCDDDRTRTFDACRAKLLALPAAIAAASQARQEELCRIGVERVVMNNRNVEAIVWTPPARPFFEKQREYPQGCQSSGHR